MVSREILVMYLNNPLLSQVLMGVLAFLIIILIYLLIKKLVVSPKKIKRDGEKREIISLKRKEKKIMEKLKRDKESVEKKIKTLKGEEEKKKPKPIKKQKIETKKLKSL